LPMMMMMMMMVSGSGYWSQFVVSICWLLVSASVAVYVRLI